MPGLGKRLVITAMLWGADLASLAEVLGCQKETFQVFFEWCMTREELCTCSLSRFRQTGKPSFLPSDIFF